MSTLEFMNSSPFLTFFMLMVVVHGIVLIVKYSIRFLNVRKNGWPPEHLDASGGFRDEDDD